ncbi:hypothetical protein K8I31_03750, partial [bacterium]|nr:hypothetical protein [bacterium]
MVKKKHTYGFVGAALLVGFSYFFFQFSFSNPVNLIDLKKSWFQPNELFITKFYKIPDTPYLFTKFTDHTSIETIYGYVAFGEQRITLIDLTNNSQIIDRYISHPSKSGFHMSHDIVFLINDEPMIQCRFLSIQSAIQSKISKFLNNISPFFMKRALNDPYNHTFLTITKDDTEQIDLNDVYRHSFYALNGKHPLIKRNKGNGISSIDSYQQLEWNDEQWESIKAFNTLYFFQSSAERSNHGYTKNTWTVHKQGRLVVHDRENLDSVLELPIDQVYQLVSPSNTNRISSLIYLNEGWNFGKSNLMFDLWKSWSNGAQTS